MCGTPSYLAPEVVLKRAEGYDQAVDSWSTGVIIYAMLTNSSPFDEQEDEPLHERVLKRKVDYNILEKLGLSSNAIDFISKLLVADPKTRMSLKDALNHPWLAGEPLKASRTAPPPPIPVPKFNNRNHVNVVDSTEKDENIKNQIQALQGELKNSSNADSTPYRNGFFQDDESSSPPKFSIPSSNYSNQNMFSSSPLPSNSKNGQNYNPKSDISCSADMSQLQLQHLSPMLKRKLPAEASDENHDEHGKKKESDNYALRERKQVKH